jgi:hypothetical protein
MSGKKRTYVSVADDELRRLREAQSRLRDVRRDLPTVLDGVRKEMRKDLDRRLSAVDDRQRRFDTAISGLGDQVRSVERNAQARLAEQGGQLRSEFDRDLTAVRHDVATRLAAQSAAVAQALDAERAARTRDMAEVRGQVQQLAASVHADQAQAEAVARQWLEGAETLRAFIETELHHQRFAPGRLAALTRLLTDALGNGEVGMWQAAAVAAQAAHRDLSELRSTLELRQRAHMALNAQLCGELRMLQERATANAKLPLSEGTEAPADGAAFVDFWTDGQNAATAAEIAELLRSSEADELDGDALCAALTDDVPRLSARLDELVELATEAEIGSQLRASIADRVVDVLADNGYDVEIDGGYEESDQRRGFLAKADHADGSRVVVTVLPMRDGRAELALHSFDEDTGDDETRRHRAEALRNQLCTEGLAMPPMVEAGGPDGRVRDVPSLVKRRAAQQARPDSRPAAGR